jgi:hypothetical protein
MFWGGGQKKTLDNWAALSMMLHRIVTLQSGLQQPDHPTSEADARSAKNARRQSRRDRDRAVRQLAKALGTDVDGPYRKAMECLENCRFHAYPLHATDGRPEHCEAEVISRFKELERLDDERRRHIRDLKSEIGGLKARLAKAERGHAMERAARHKFEALARKAINALSPFASAVLFWRKEGLLPEKREFFFSEACALMSTEMPDTVNLELGGKRFYLTTEHFRTAEEATR